MTDKTGALALALLKAQREVEAAQKKGRNKFHGYKYASADEMIAVGRQALNDNDLTLAEDSAVFQALASPLGGAAGILRAAYRLEHASGEWRLVTLDVPVCPEESKGGGFSRPLDKSLFAARTEGLGYALRGILLIEREEEGISGRDDRPTREEPRAQEKAHPTVSGSGETNKPPTAPKLQAAPTEAASDVAAIQSATTLEGAARAYEGARSRLGINDDIQAAYAQKLIAASEKATARQVEIIDGYLNRANFRPGPLQSVETAIKKARPRHSGM